MGHSVFGGMQRLNIEAARRQAGQELLQTPNPAGLPPTTAETGTPISLSTPDILNSLIAITNPFFESTSALTAESENATQGCSATDPDEPQEKKVFANLETPITTSGSSLCQSSSASSTIQNQQNCMTTFSSTISSSKSSILTSGAGGMVPISTTTPPQPSPLLLPPLQFSLEPQPLSSVQSMRSQLIKEGLKLTIQTKRKNSGKEELDVKSELVVKRSRREEVEFDFSISNDSLAGSLSPTKLTPEDEERRRRRRERNKVAATKCRNKKKEKTCLLVQEAEILESENVSMKSEIAQLEEEQQRLTALLASHAPSCTMNVHQTQKPSMSSNHNNIHHHHNINNSSSNSSSNMMMDSPYPTSAAVGHDYNSQNPQHNLAISSHHNNNHHNPFVGSNINYFNQIHHQTIQLS